MNRLLLTVMTALLLSIGSVWASPLEDGDTAYNRGDYAEAIKSFRVAAMQGEATAESNLGVMYANGQGVPQDHSEAMKWYRLAAAQGDASAQCNIGIEYANGQGVPQDYVEAMKWYRLAAARRNRIAQFNLGVIYNDGKHTTRNYAEAAKWFQLAATQGDVQAKPTWVECITKGEVSPRTMQKHSSGIYKRQSRMIPEHKTISA